MDELGVLLECGGDVISTFRVMIRRGRLFRHLFLDLLLPAESGRETLEHLSDGPVRLQRVNSDEGGKGEDQKPEHEQDLNDGSTDLRIEFGFNGQCLSRSHWRERNCWRKKKAKTNPYQ